MSLSLCLIKVTFSESAVTWSEAAAQLSVCLVAKLVGGMLVFSSPFSFNLV